MKVVRMLRKVFYGLGLLASIINVQDIKTVTVKKAVDKTVAQRRSLQVID